MPSRKQRQRKQKAKRHEYETVWLDDEGNVLDEPPPEELERRQRTNGAAAATATKSTKGSHPQRGAQRGNRREPQPPSWQRAAKRSLLLVVFFMVIISFGSKGHILVALPEALAFGILYVPVMYWMDRWIYRRFEEKRAAAGRSAATPRPAKKR